jgi:gliding motility-associated-like protein
MSKRLLLLSTILAFSLSSQAQVGPADTLFNIPDTVCAGHQITPTDVVAGASNYSWTFCPPKLDEVPLGQNLGKTFNLSPANGITVVQDGSNYVGFAINTDGTLVKLRFNNGLDNAPLQQYLGNMGGNMPASPSGLQLVKDGDTWRLFVIGGSNLDNTSIVRFDFAGGLSADATSALNLGNTDGLLEKPSQLFVSKNTLDDNWYAFTFNNGEDLVRLNFGTNITSLPSATFLGNISNAFESVSGLTSVLEAGNWHLYTTNRTSNSITHITFGNSLGNTPFALNLGTLGNRLIAPTGIAITKDCQDYYGYVLNNGGSGLVRVYWSASVADAPTSSSILGNVAAMVQPRALSSFVSQNGGLYLFAPNSDSSLSQINFPACTDASISSSSEPNPTFSYNDAGVYTVFLTVDQGLPTVRTYCKDITIEAAPPLTVSNDTLICVGDTITLFGLANGTDDFTWTPDFNINTLEGRLVRVWPDYSTDYVLTVGHAPNCIVHDTVKVSVSKVVADAGHDREFTDGSSTILGGPGTTLGPQYTYRWFPTFFITGNTDSAITTARPNFDITYYLEVTNTDGCRAIDSVIVSVSCDNVNLPNAFVPGSSNPKVATFGIENLQISQLNHFRIYDRWGKLVFNAANENDRWNGMVDGREAPIGAYVWDIDFFCNKGGNRQRRSGTVTLIR